MKFGGDRGSKLDQTRVVREIRDGMIEMLWRRAVFLGYLGFAECRELLVVTWFVYQLA